MAGDHGSREQFSGNEDETHLPQFCMDGSVVLCCRVGHQANHHSPLACAQNQFKGICNGQTVFDQHTLDVKEDSPPGQGPQNWPAQDWGQLHRSSTHGALSGVGLIGTDSHRGSQNG
jgi:hypothetical protein